MLHIHSTAIVHNWPLQERAEQAESMLSERQGQELSELVSRQQAQMAGWRPKFSTELLNLRHIEATLSKQWDFSKAEQVSTGG